MDKPTFEELARLTNREVQILLREIDQKDLVIALSGATDAQRTKWLSNMSQRVRTFIEDEIQQVHVKQGEVGEVQGRVIQQVMQLAEQGWITWPPVPASKRRKASVKPSKQYTAMKRRLRTEVGRRLDEMSNEEIDEIFRHLADVARAEGILALEAFAGQMGDSFMQDGFRLAVDGTEPDLILGILTTWLESLEHEYRRKHQKVIEGIMSDWMD